MSTEIAWTEDTWNPVTGCDRVSAGCDHCYAMTLAKRLKAMGQAKYQNDGDPRTSGPGFGVTCHPDALDIPLRWRKPRRVFVNSMSDLFHKDVPDEFVADVFNTMALTERHTYQILTKRPQRMAQVMSAYARCEHGWLTHNGENPTSYGETGRVIPTADKAGPTKLLPDGTRVGTMIYGPWPLPNVWLGTSVENQRYADLRIPHLLATPAAVRFLSIEPLLGPVNLQPWLPPNPRLADIGWVIIGGESGPGARPMEREWAQDIVDVCRQYDVPVFVKQLGTVLGGKHHQDVETFPAGLQVREYPA